MSTAGLFWTSITTLLMTAIIQFGVRALRNFSRHDLEEICRLREKPERFSEILQYHDIVSLGIEMIASLTTALAVVAGTFWAAQAWEFAPEATPTNLITVAVLLGVVLAATGTWLPWANARLFSEEFLFYTWPVWKVLAMLGTPLVWGAKLIDTVLHRIVGRTPHLVDEETIEEEIRTIVSEGHREGLLEEDAREMIEGVIDLGDADVAEIMTPRTDMHMIPVDMPWDELIDDMIQAGHTRVPVYDTSRDDIIGILYSKDLLPELATGDPETRTPIRELMRKPVFVPQTKPVDDLLQMFQQLRTHIAVVLDEYGGVSGLVTIEDVLEEIVGEIVDEYDEDLIEEIEKIDDNTIEALGRAHVDEINSAMNLDLPDDGDFDTIGGFVFTELGRVPIRGEKITWQDKVEIHVLEVTKRRIDRVRIHRMANGQLEIA